MDNKVAQTFEVMTSQQIDDHLKNTLESKQTAQMDLILQSRDELEQGALSIRSLLDMFDVAEKLGQLTEEEESFFMNGDLKISKFVGSDEPCGRPGCTHTKHWHSLQSQQYVPAFSGCLAGCSCKGFVPSGKTFQKG